MRLNSIFALIFTSIIAGCDIRFDNIPEKTNTVISRFPQEYQEKFFDLIDHYDADADSLKRKAAYFLINHIEDHFYYSGKPIRDFMPLFEVLDQKSIEWKKNIYWNGKHISNILDSIFHNRPLPRSSGLTQVNDIDSITTEYLIENIDLAYKMWKKPWAQHVTFPEFCKYILPYRTYNEPLRKWRADFIDKFKYAEDNLDNPYDVLEIGKLLSDTAQIKYNTTMEKYPGHLSPDLLLRSPVGTCVDITNYKLLAMRAMGVPVMIDFVPIWGNGYNGHFWNAILDNHGNTVSFIEALDDENANIAFKMKMAKVFRKTYARQKERVKLLIANEGDVPSFFKNVHAKDVTKQYVAVNDVKLILNDKAKHHEYAFLSVFNRGLYPIDFGHIKNNRVTFNNVGRDVCYFPVYYKHGSTISASNPFILTKKGWIKELIPDTSHNITLTLNRKYPMEEKRNSWLKCVMGAKVQGANNLDFSDATTIYTINNKPSQHLKRIDLSKHNKFKYVRLLFNFQNKKSLLCGSCLAELAFFGAEGERLEGDVISSPCDEYYSNTPENVFDGNILTYYEDESNRDQKFIGLDFGKPKKITSIAFCPRNDKNCVQKGHQYELNYWHKGRFKTHTRKIAQDTLLHFHNVPSNTIYWLKNLTEGKEERIFTYEGDKQIWW